MPEVVLQGIVKQYGSVRATDNVDLTIADGEFVTLLGPSGCGKTTLLRSIAGLERPDEGVVRLGDRVVADGSRKVFVPPEKRHLGMVFQSYALWPHLSVRSNIAYPLRTRRNLSRAQIDQRVTELMEVVGLTGMHRRLISELSGGQQQRVALARALAGGTELVLYDEPLSNLDAGMRITMRDEIRKVHDEMGTTSIFVTHDQEEALALSDRVVLMNKGQIVQSGTPHEVYASPKNSFVARFLGFENILGLERVDGPDGANLVLAGGAITLPAVHFPRLTPDHNGMAIKSSHLRIARGVRPDAEPVLRGRVRSRSYAGDRTHFIIEVNGVVLRAMVLNHLVAERELPAEDELTDVQFPADLLAPLTTDETPANQRPETQTIRVAA